jgi:uncharacterized protein YceK
MKRLVLLLLVVIGLVGCSQETEKDVVTEAFNTISTQVELLDMNAEGTASLTLVDVEGNQYKLSDVYYLEGHGEEDFNGQWATHLEALTATMPKGSTLVLLSCNVGNEELSFDTHGVEVIYSNHIVYYYTDTEGLYFSGEWINAGEPSTEQYAVERDEDKKVMQYMAQDVGDLTLNNILSDLEEAGLEFEVEGGE